MNPPRVSVVIPAYNEERFIAATIASVLGQTLADFELVVGDNASTDRTCEVVRTFQDPRLRLCEYRDHVGPAANFNRTLAEAHADFIKLLPADDVLYSTCLEKQVQILAQPGMEEVVMVSCVRDVIDESGRMIHRPRPKLHGRIAGLHAVRRAIRAGANIIGEPLGVLLRRSALDKVGGFNDSLPFMLDMDLWCRLLLGGDLFAMTEPLGAFRISRQSMSFTMLGRQTKQFHQFINERRSRPEYQLSRGDIFFGKINSFIREIVRWGAYLFYLPWKPSPPTLPQGERAC